MRKGKSFICSILQFVVFIIAAIIGVLLFETFIGLIVAGFITGAGWLLFESMEEKGKFTSIDQKIYDTRVFSFLIMYKKIVYFFLFAIAMILTLFFVVA